MCRLALFNPSGIDMIEHEIGLNYFLKCLETSCGGHGNGIALLKKDGKVEMQKGVGLTTHEIADRLRYNRDWKWGLFHTRIASVSEISDRNCHPFRDGNLTIAMNGTESGFSTLGNMLNITDTEAVLKTIKKFKLPPISTISELNSVYVGFHKDLPFVTSGSYGDLEIMYKGDAICFASEFPIKVDAFEPAKKPFVWWEGKKIEVIKRTFKSYKYKQGYYDYYDEDYYYNYRDVKSNTSTNVIPLTTSANKESYCDTELLQD